ncbi:MAG: D-alanyl-D-alanine carboxypeptidase [Parvibaculum sp.]
MRASAFKASTQKLAAGRVSLRRFLATIALGLTICLTISSTDAQAFTPKSASLVMDASNGRILYSRNADEQCYPASLTKVMTLYLLFGELESGKLSLNTRLKASRHAANQAPSRLGLKPGETIRVQDAILALVTKSANDVAVVVAERLGGSETKFAEMMTAKAKQLGMKHTRYMNASGLPNRSQLTTARDQATLAKHIQTDFPQYYRYFSTRTFAWDGRVFKNHNHLLGKYAGISGLKTGYTAASGFNLTTSVQRNGRSVIGVVLGGKTSRARDKQMVAILDQTMPKAVVMRDVGATQIASNEPAPTPILRPASDALDNLVASMDDPDPDEESYTGTEQVASLSAPAPAPLRAAANDAPPVTKTIVTTTVAPPVTAQSAAPLDQATAYALAALGKAEGPVRRVGRDIGGLIVTPALASEGAQPTSPVGLRKVAHASDPATPSHGWAADDPLIPDGSWVIQIGAYSDQGDAVSRIRDAMKAAPTELSKAVPVTIPVRSTDNKMLYRSRFGGFDDEKEARNACGRLARQRISCIAIPPANWSLPQGKSANNSARG